jgi:hypothetical protein
MQNSNCFQQESAFLRNAGGSAVSPVQPITTMIAIQQAPEWLRPPPPRDFARFTKGCAVIAREGSMVYRTHSVRKTEATEAGTVISLLYLLFLKSKSSNRKYAHICSRYSLKTLGGIDGLFTQCESIPL